MGRDRIQGPMITAQHPRVVNLESRQTTGSQDMTTADGTLLPLGLLIKLQAINTRAMAHAPLASAPGITVPTGYHYNTGQRHRMKAARSKSMSSFLPDKACGRGHLLGFMTFPARTRLRQEPDCFCD